MKSNYYLSLLYTKTKELKKLLEKVNSLNYSDEYKKYLISGYIITIDSILEIGIGDLHSSDFDEITSLIYYTRQKAVHYGYFNGLHSIESTANKIIDLVEKHYKDEQKYYEKLFDSISVDDVFNIVITNSSSIAEDLGFYKFKSKDEKHILCVPAKRIFRLTRKSKEKVVSYIIDTSFPLALYSCENGISSDYKEICDDEIKSFIKENFSVIDENYTKHIDVINEILQNFIKDPINSIQITEYDGNEQFCRNTIEVIKEFILEKTLYSNYLKSYHLIKDKYSIKKMEKVDYTKLQSAFHKNAINFINQKDAFFIDMTIKRADYYSSILKDPNSTLDLDIEILSPVLIQLFETGPKYFSEKFVSSHPEFTKCIGNLLKYRHIFSHYVLSSNEYRDGIISFKNEFLGLLKLLRSIDLTQIKLDVDESYASYSIIEKNKSDFFNYKHEQYLKINSTSYIGKKILYSSKIFESKSLIAIIPSGRNSSNTMYYKKGATDYLVPDYTIDPKSGKKIYINTHIIPLMGTKEVVFDTNISNLFKAYSELKKINVSGSISIIFNPCKENNNLIHYDDLNTVILRYFNQGYLPIELLQKTKLNLDRVREDVIELLDESNTPIATIINTKKQNINAILSVNKDPRCLFSRIDAIQHSFSKRRHP